MKKRVKSSARKGRGKIKPPRRIPQRGETVWDQASRWYNNLVGLHGTDFQKDIIMPGSLRLLDLKKGDRVLDLACGQGVFSRYLAARGMRVEGLDSSEELVRFAGSQSKSTIRFHVANARNPSVLKDSHFEAIACLLALQNMEEIEPVFRNAARWLKPNGRFVLVVTHPCFRIPRQSHWGWDEERKIEYRRVDHYASEVSIPILTPPMARSKLFTMTYHRPLEAYFNALSLAGLCVDRLEEWVSKKESQPGKRARAENRARKEIPVFLALRARLIPGK